MPRHGKISEFWLRLREIVGEKFDEMSQKQVAKEFGVGQSMATRWKTGKDTPRLRRAIEMSLKSGVCVEWLLTGRGPKFPAGTEDPKLAALLEIWSRLEPESQDELVKYARYQRMNQVPKIGKS